MIYKKDKKIVEMNILEQAKFVREILEELKMLYTNLNEYELFEMAYKKMKDMRKEEYKEEQRGDIL